MIVRDHQLEAEEPALAELQQEVAPARAALAVGELDREDAAPTGSADAERQQHRLAADHPGLAHPLVADIDDQMRAGLVETPPGELR
jgi:hypothetical protein